MYINERIILKIWGIFLCFTILCVTVHHISNEIYFERFPGIFLAFINIYLNNHIDLNYISLVPLIESNIPLDPSLSHRVQGIAINESYFPGFVVHFLILHYISGLSPQTLLILPLGVLFIPITYFALIRAYVPINDNYGNIFHIFLGLYFTLFLSSTKFYGSFYVAPTALLLVLVIFLCTNKFYDNYQRPRYYVIFCLTSLSLVNTWHSMHMIALFYILALCIIDRAFCYLFPSFRHHNWTKGILIISIILALSFTRLWQSNYLMIYLAEANITEFISKLQIKLFGGVAFPVPYAFNYKELPFGNLYFNSYLLILIFNSLILLIPIALCVIQLMQDIKTKTNIHLLRALSGAISIIIAQIINVIAYYKSGSINFPYVTLFFPFFGLALFMRINGYQDKLKKLLIFFISIATLLSLLCVLSMYLTNEAGQTSVTKFKDTQNSFEWSYYHTDKNRSVIVDFNILGKYLSREAKISTPDTKYLDLTPSHYCILVGDDIPNHNLSGDYVVIDHATMSNGLPIHSVVSRSFLKPELDRIKNCTNQNKLYEDNYISLFMFKVVNRRLQVI